MSAADLLAMLRETEHRVAVAESCTGGLLGATLTAVPGSSESFAGGVIAYDDALKMSMLGLDPGKLDKHGSVSAYAVEAMAHAVRDRFGSDMGLAVSGIAGPGGGTLRKPVGTVWMAVSGPEHLLDVRRLKIKGDRDEVRRGAVEAILERAVELVREARLEAGPGRTV